MSKGRDPDSQEERCRIMRTRVVRIMTVQAMREQRWRALVQQSARVKGISEAACRKQVRSRMWGSLPEAAATKIWGVCPASKNVLYMTGQAPRERTIYVGLHQRQCVLLKGALEKRVRLTHRSRVQQHSGGGRGKKELRFILSRKED